MRRALAALLFLLAGCQHEAPPEPVVRFQSQKMGIEWDRMPESVPERRRLAEAEAREGERLVGAGHFALGVAHLRRAVDLHPGSAALRRRLAAGFERLGDPDAALRVLREATRVAPRDPGTLYDLGRVVLVALKSRHPPDLEEARRAWRTLREVAPDSALAREATARMAELERALAEARAAHDGGVAAALPEAVPGPGAAAAVPPPPPRPPISPATATDALLAGNELMERGRFADAARAYARAEGPEARRLEGLAHHRAGAFREAVKAWEALARLSRLDPETRRLLEEARKRIR